MTTGVIMLDIRGTELEQDEEEIINHPMVAGVILFSRNYESPEQIADLCRQLRAAATQRLLIAVDQEGGRVQRFRQGFSDLPACHLFGEIYDKDPQQGLELSNQAGWLMASELLAVGIDFSFAPVLDLYKGISQVIGDRAFHEQPQSVSRLAQHYISGMREAGMASVGKHFPGHGSVIEDSHTEIPNDHRRYEDILMDDLITFQNLIDAGLTAIMPAHVIYPKVDQHPAGFSEIWLNQILRQQLNFNGVIFSDDISMAGAEVAGDFLARTHAALNAGCDIVLICNQQDQAIHVLDNIHREPDPLCHARLIRMQGKPSGDFQQMRRTEQWQSTKQRIEQLTTHPELGLGDDCIH